MSRDLENRITDYFKWFRENQPNVINSGDLRKVAEFHGKALDGALELLAISAKDIQKLEFRNRAIDQPGTRIWVPPEARR